MKYRIAALLKLKHSWYVQAYQRTVESSNLQEKVSGIIRLKVLASSTDVLASARLSTCIAKLKLCGPRLACIAQHGSAGAKMLCSSGWHSVPRCCSQFACTALHDMCWWQESSQDNGCYIALKDLFLKCRCSTRTLTLVTCQRQRRLSRYSQCHQFTPSKPYLRSRWAAFLKEIGIHVPEPWMCTKYTAVAAL